MQEKNFQKSKRNPILEFSICLGLLIQLSFFAWWTIDGQDTRYIKFVSEELSIDLYSGSAETKGVYNFENNARFSVPLTLSYPFPKDSFEVKEVRFNGEIQPYIEKDNELLISARFPGTSISTLEVIYKEDINNEYEYILSSTRSWKHSLERATFNIYLHDDLDIMSSNYEFTQTDPEVYSMNKEDFWPEDNLILTLNEKDR